MLRQAYRRPRYTRRRHMLMSSLLFIKMVLSVVALHIAEVLMHEPDMLVLGLLVGAAVAVLAPVKLLEGLD